MAANIYDDDDLSIPEYEPIRRLTRDLRRAAELLTSAEVRYLIDRYYQVQEDRKRGANQLRAASIDREPNTFLTWVAGQVESFEGVCKAALTIVSRRTVPGRWAQTVFGVGPVLTAGLLANLDVTRAAWPSAFWRFSGLDPSKEWLGSDKAKALLREVEGEFPARTPVHQLIDPVALRIKTRPDYLLNLIEHQTRGKNRQAPPRPLEDVRARVTREQLVRALATRPWNAQLKVLAWKLGASFNKIYTNPKDTMYGKLYAERKDREWERNFRGDYQPQAEIARAGRTLTDEQRPWYLGHYDPAELQPQWDSGVNPSQWEITPVPGKGLPMLPPGRIELRSRRIAVKMFLSHLHHVMFEDHYGKPPDRPYIFAHDPRHVHYIAPPNWPMS